jgi:uncharacterized protein
MDPVHVVFTKWGDRPHWEYDALRLGEDEHGTWVGMPVGTAISRPGVSFQTDQPQVALFPDAPYAACFYGPGGHVPCDVYVDITTPPVWRDGTVTAVDLDLDVLLGRTGRVWVDDEEEFAEHRARYRYPDDIVEMATRSCSAVLGAVSARLPPYDRGTWTRWLDLLKRA